jgi:hypothetical protein
MLSSWAYLLAALAATGVANEQKRAPSGCKSLETKFGSAIAYPGSASYTNETTGTRALHALTYAELILDIQAIGQSRLF